MGWGAKGIYYCTMLGPLFILPYIHPTSKPNGISGDKNGTTSNTIALTLSEKVPPSNTYSYPSAAKHNVTYIINPIIKPLNQYLFCFTMLN